MTPSQDNTGIKSKALSLAIVIMLNIFFGVGVATFSMRKLLRLLYQRCLLSRTLY